MLFCIQLEITKINLTAIETNFTILENGRRQLKALNCRYNFADLYIHLMQIYVYMFKNMKNYQKIVHNLILIEKIHIYTQAEANARKYIYVRLGKKVHRLTKIIS